MRDLLQYLLGLTSAARVGAAGVGRNLATWTLALLTPVACLAQTRAGQTFDAIARPAAPVTHALRLSSRVEPGAAAARTVASSSPRLRIELKLPIQAPGNRFQSQTSTTATKTSGPWWHGVLWGVAGGIGGFFAGGYIGDAIDRQLAKSSHEAPDIGGGVIGSLTGAVVGAVVLAKIGP